MLWDRQDHAVCNLLDHYMVATGGEHENGLNTAEIYDITTNKWTALPKLNVGRSNHSSCSIDRVIYVFCGYCQSDENSVERLDFDKYNKKWQFVKLDFDILTPREMTVAYAVNETEIAIIGGRADNYLADVIIYDTQKSSVTKLPVTECPLVSKTASAVKV